MLIYSTLQQTLWWYFLVATASLLGSKFTDRKYYTEITSNIVFSPPPFLFGIVWPVLYALQAQASFWVQQEHGGWSSTLSIYISFLIVSIIWNFTFFYLKNLTVALLFIVASFILFIISNIQYFGIQALSGWFMVPTSIWLLFATALMGIIWIRNYNTDKPFTNQKSNRIQNLYGQKPGVDWD
jgi:tryptophan-rich sensory protein